MRAGRLRHRVTFETATVTDDDFGEPDQSWASITTVWAGIEPTAGKERFAAMQHQSEIDTLIVCRYHTALSALAPKDRATWNSKTFDIKAVINVDERNKELHIFARLNN